MPRRAPPATAPRKLPVQARSTQLVADILKAAVRVLEREGPQRFTTIRVAETAGVSVGSLYQYFPNKEAILFRLQVEEWATTSAMLDALLGDTSLPPSARLRATIRAFFRTECDEAPLRLALDAAAPTYRTAPEVRASRVRSRRVVSAFLVDVAPRATAAQRRFASELTFTTMSAIGSSISERRPGAATTNRWADALTEMLMTYFARLRPSAPSFPMRSEQVRPRARLSVRAAR